MKVYKNPEEFWRQVSPYLLIEETKNNLFLGLADAFREKAKDCLYQGAVFDGERLLGALICSRYLGNIHFVPSVLADPRGAPVLFESYLHTGLRAQGLVAEVKTAREFKELFERNGGVLKVHMTQGIYRCRTVKPPGDNAGLFLRAAVQSDVSKIGEWVEAFQKEALPLDPPVNGAQFADSKIRAGAIFVVEKEGDPVAMAGMSRDIGTSCSVNLVYTPENWRGRGYASALVAKLTQHLLDQGRREINLYTDMGNPTSNKIYQNVGYEFICDSVHYGIE